MAMVLLLLSTSFNPTSFPIMMGFITVLEALIQEPTPSQLGDFSTGHVGGPFAGVDICLQDVPEMGYLHTDSWHGKTPIAG